MSAEITKLNRNELAALRHVAVHAVNRACPMWKKSQIARALNIDPATVGYHLRRRYKGVQLTDAPRWQAALIAGCGAMATGDMANAYVKFHDVTKTIEAINARDSASAASKQVIIAQLEPVSP